MSVLNGLQGRTFGAYSRRKNLAFSVVSRSDHRRWPSSVRITSGAKRFFETSLYGVGLYETLKDPYTGVSRASSLPLKTSVSGLPAAPLRVISTPTSLSLTPLDPMVTLRRHHRNRVDGYLIKGFRLPAPRLFGSFIRPALPCVSSSSFFTRGTRDFALKKLLKSCRNPF